MTDNDVRILIQSWKNLPILVQYIVDHPEYLDVVMSKAMDDSQPEYWRAMWLVDQIHERHPELIQAYLPALIRFLFVTKNTSKKRHLLKIISLFDVANENLAPLLIFCSEVFTNPDEPVAVRVNAMQILYNIAQKEPGFSGELIDMIAFELEFHSSAGIASRGQKLMSKLHKMPKDRTRVQ